MRNLRIRPALACLTFALLLSACATQEEPEVAAAPPLAPPPAATAPQAAPGPAPVTSIIPGSRQDFEQNVGDRVFFGYDRSDLDQQDRDVLQRQAEWLARYPQVVLVLEGHADERGTREYNLALGARRAASVTRISDHASASARRGSRRSPTARNVRSAASPPSSAGRRTAAAFRRSAAARSLRRPDQGLRGRACPRVPRAPIWAKSGCSPTLADSRPKRSLWFGSANSWPAWLLSLQGLRWPHFPPRRSPRSAKSTISRRRSGGCSVTWTS